MHVILAALAMAIGVLAPTLASACERDFDCPGGSRCVKRFGALQGACVRGAAPIEGDERRPRGRDVRGEVGEPCDFDEDCASGLACVQQGRSGRRACSP